MKADVSGVSYRTGVPANACGRVADRFRRRCFDPTLFTLAVSTGGAPEREVVTDRTLKT
jgi:hypothetical protein